MGIHRKYGGSTAARTIACPAWVSRSKDIPRRGSGPYAVRGSMLHEVMEQCRLEGIKPQDVLDRGFTYKDDEGNELTFTEDHIDDAEIAYHTLEEHLDDLDIDAFDIEPLVDIIPEKVGGSIDYLGVSEDGKEVLIADYKFGSMVVGARDNKQLLFYALAAQTDPKTAAFFEKAENITLSIIQPKAKGVRSSWTAPVSVLDDYRSRLLDAIDDAESDKPTALAGSHCNWCPFEPYCKEKKAQVRAAMTLSTDNSESLEDALAIVDQVESWAKEVKNEAHRMLEKGVPIHGWKLVGKKATRTLINVDAAVSELVDMGIPIELLRVPQDPKTLTGPQMATLVKKKIKAKEITPPKDFDFEKQFIKKVAPEGTTLAPADDPREEIIMGQNTENLENLFKGS